MVSGSAHTGGESGMEVGKNCKGCLRTGGRGTGEKGPWTVSLIWTPREGHCIGQLGDRGEAKASFTGVGGCAGREGTERGEVRRD